ncbi:MAG: Gfo/Idh/MocA family oxidoreductase [Deltaproteobacteria bacterium]|nr:Gfo/Idh/MocA family oxidoreductase [Deltaproteobacteria bacterium]MBW2151080.1 Gfo/Idh/MocA family oxidoreductase [Deltaproteobacteria bacterium]
MNRPVKVGIIGAGFAGAFHLRSYRQVYGVPVEVVAIAGKTKIRAEKLAKTYNVPNYYDDYRYIIDDKSIDVVDLVVPNALHLPMVLEAARAGKHIICEKPLTGYFGRKEPDDEVGTTPKREMLVKVREDLKLVRKVMAENPVKFCYADNWIYAPAFKKALELMEKCFVSGSILEIRGDESHSGSHAEYAKYWKHAGGGAMARLAAHPIAAGLFLKQYEGEKKYGKPVTAKEVWADTVDLTRTEAFKHAKNSPLGTGWKDVETWSQLTITFTDGTRGIFFGADDLLGGMESEIEIRMTNCRLKFRLCLVRDCQFYIVDPAPVEDVYFNEKQETRAGLSFPNPDEEWTLGYPHEIQDFMEAIAYNRAPLTGLELAMQLVEVLYAGYVSCEEGRKISLE